MIFNLIHPSKGRPLKSAQTFWAWSEAAKYPQGARWLCSLDWDEDIASYMDAYAYMANGFTMMSPIIFKNRSAVDAINNAAKHWRADGEIFIVVSDDTSPCEHWDEKILKEVEGKADWILKTQDGIQKYIITMPVLDRVYYNRTGYIYHPDFEHQFCDTYATCVADITGRKITSNLLFPHLNDSIKDDLRKKTDGTWKQGQETFIRLMKEFSPSDRAKITDPAMKNWLRNHGVR